MKLCFATNNLHKIQEIEAMLGGGFELQTLEAVDCFAELPETQNTLEGNSLQKAQYVWDNFKISCFADDTGLEVVALNNAPGVYSARYAGDHRSSEDNINLLLKNLANTADRSAQFRTVITLILLGKVYSFEGIVKGKITKQRRGSMGFGYDSIFVPDGFAKSFAEMAITEKTTISHRAKAFEQLVAFLH